MTVFAAVMTGKGTGAISTIQVFGNSAEDAIRKIFKPAATKPVKFKTSEILLGQITNGTNTIDHVVIGCEGPETFAINCHGNPLIVADIMELLQRYGAKLLTAEELLTKILSEEKHVNTIALEAKLARVKAKTIEGAKIITNQINAGLSKKLTEWLQNINTISLDETTSDAERILEASQTAKLIITGCKAVITGPPNSGKSTLLNCLAGKQKAIVTDIKGTTRDWVTAQCQITTLSVELIDTAGLDEKLAATSENAIEKESQKRTARMLKEADLVLLVLDNSQPAEQINDQLVEKTTCKKVLTVLNKSDLPARFDTAKLPQALANTVQISAKFGTGIENLIEKIAQICGTAEFDLQQPICFTSRQEKLLTQLSKAKSKDQVVSAITELLNGKLRV